MTEASTNDVRRDRREPKESDRVSRFATRGLGLGATTSIFTIARGVLLEPLPFPTLIAAGLVLSRATAGFLDQLLYGVGSSEALSIAIAVIAVALVSLLASVSPARRAAHVDPAVVLRNE